MPRYNPAVLEPKWQRFWSENRTFAAPRMPQGEKLYVLDMFPYPSGDGLHVGHPEGYTATDIYCRYQRMRGKSVLHPMGWDAFGLPAEQHAIKTGTPPRETTEKNIANFRRQLQMLGFSYDWQRELGTTDVGYFRWTQWIFLQLYDTWFDAAAGRGRPLAELPIPPEIAAAGADAVGRYQDERRLAYQSQAPVNWCPALGTVLSNEEVKDGLSERGSHPVQRLPLRQWMLRITAYADRLENDLVGVDWPESVKTMQREWIGRSTGAEIDFYVGPAGVSAGDRPAAYSAWKQTRPGAGFPARPPEETLRIFTTRPDTLFGATYMVLSPEHPLVPRLTRPEQAAAVAAYREQAARKSDLDRTDLAKEKTGVFTGAYAINPVQDALVPIWVADYVLMGYGTGAIMAVPAHDVRDHEFALAFGLPVLPVVDPGEQVSAAERAAVLARQSACTLPGVAINSGPYDGLATTEFKSRLTTDLASAGVGRAAAHTKLRDWLFSRQHFWGEPFPLLHELSPEGQPTGRVRTVPEAELPVDLPEMRGFKPHGRPDPPLEEAPPEWLYPVVDGVRYKRETNTMPQWAGSCWYYLRFLDPHNANQFVDPAVERAWMPVDLYIGGAEHAVLHLLYARFWHKVLFDRGLVSTPEPFGRLINQGMILGEIEFTAYRQADGTYVSTTQVTGSSANGYFTKDGLPVAPQRLAADHVEKRGEHFVLVEAPEVRVESRAHKMSKSRGNVVNPDAVVREYGADALRLYEMFMGPLEATKPWSMEGVNGVRGFLDRVWRMITQERSETDELHPAVADVDPTPEQNRVLHRTIQGVTQDIEKLAFNTAIAKLMEFTNFFLKEEVRPRQAMSTMVLLLSPLAPHLAEELWQQLGNRHSLAYHPWPEFDPELIREETQEIPIQVLGKLRARVTVVTGADAQELEAAARAEPRIVELLTGKTVVKTIVVPGRLVNFVIK